jgi:hypothetical protein
MAMSESSSMSTMAKWTFPSVAAMAASNLKQTRHKLQ